MSPERGAAQAHEKIERLFEVRNLGEADGNDIVLFQKSVEGTNGFVDLVIHPFFLKGYKEFRREDIQSKYSVLSPEVHKMRENAFNTLVKNVFDQSEVPKALRSTVLVMEEYVSIGSVEKDIKSLFKDESFLPEAVEEPQNIFAFPTVIGDAIPHSRKIARFMYPGEPEKGRDDIFTFFCFLWEMGVRKLRISGGYLTYEKMESGKEILNRCVGNTYRALVAFNGLVEKQYSHPGFDIDLSYATFPENPQTLKEKGAEI